MLLLCVLAVSHVAEAQPQPGPSAPAQTFTLAQAIQYAVDHYPTVRAALEQVNASTAGVDIARAAYLPRLDSLWQTNRATANNIFGQVLPQSVIPAMSGPVLSGSSGRSVWGSAAGALFSWEPFDFGLRKAGVDGAEAAVARAKAGEALTRLDVESAVGMEFLAILSAERAVTAAEADLERREVLARITHTLVDNQLRPGADASRADAERAAADTRVIQARQMLNLARTAMVRVLGLNAPTVAIDATNLLDRVPTADFPAGPATAHPLAQVRQAAVDVTRAAQQSLKRTDLPRVYLQSSVFARGSGASPTGTFDGGVDGLGLERANWAAGVQVLFPNLFDFGALHARQAAAEASMRAETALYDEALLTINGQQQAAAVVVEASRAVAASTPVQVAAARQSAAQAQTRYQAGLAALTEVADAQSLLAQAEYQDQLARVDVWRALLAEAVAQGSLAPFLQLVSSGAP